MPGGVRGAGRGPEGAAASVVADRGVSRGRTPHEDHLRTRHRQGIEQGERRSALRLMEAKFGPLSPEVKRQVEALSPERWPDSRSICSRRKPSRNSAWASHERTGPTEAPRLDRAPRPVPLRRARAVQRSCCRTPVPPPGGKSSSWSVPWRSRWSPTCWPAREADPGTRSPAGWPVGWWTTGPWRITPPPGPSSRLGSGAGIGTMSMTIGARRASIRSGRSGRTTGPSGVGAGASRPATSGPRTGTGMRRSTGTPAWASGSPEDHPFAELR